MVFGVAHFRSLNELMLYNALALHQRQLLRLQQDDEWTELLQVSKSDCDVPDLLAGIIRESTPVSRTCSLDLIYASSMKEKVILMCGNIDMWCDAQDAAGEISRVVQAIMHTHWAAFLLDKDLSRTRRMKGLILQLFCEHWSLKAAAQQDPEALHSICKSSGIQLARHAEQSCKDVGSLSRKDRKRKAKHREKHKKDKKHKERESSENNHEFTAEDLDFDNAHQLDDVHADLWDIAQGAYKASCASRDAPQYIMYMSACARFETYVTAQT